MSRIRRLIVEKKDGFNVEAEQVRQDLSHTLGITGLKTLRIFNIYDVEGLSEEELEKGRRLVFSEPPADDCYDEELPLYAGEMAFGFMYLPGQYDQRADSAAQCLEIITGHRVEALRCSRVWAMTGEISEEELAKIKGYAINPVDSTEVSLDKPASIREEAPPPNPVAEIRDFLTMDDVAFRNLYESLSLAMSEEDFGFTREYFLKEKRNPTLTEIKVLDTYWSDHCRHTTFMTVIDHVSFSPGFFTEPVKRAWKEYLWTRTEVYQEPDMGKRPPCLMDIATIAMKEMRKNGGLDDLDESDEINACTIKIKVDHEGKAEDWLFLFKNETHNHPTEIEPFGGAATCLGGAIRDPLSGRAYVYQAMRVTGAADPRVPVEKTLKGKLPQRKICKEAARGYSSYGNQIGLATGKVAEIYDDAFVAKRLEVGAVVGAAPQENVRREAPQKGDIVLLLGGRTGRDGIGGATGSSKEHTEESIKKSGAEVQKGNPPTERKLQRLFRDGEVTKMIKRCNDFGAGGVSVAVGELTDSLFIDLDQVPLKYSGLDGTEVAVSESQERMAVVIAAGDEKAFMAKARGENLECTKIAAVTDSNRLEMVFKGQKVVDLARDFVNSGGVRQHTDIEVLPPEPINPFSALAKTRDRGTLAESLIAMAMDLNIGSQKGLGEMFDGTIGASSVLMPFGGKNQLTPSEGMAAHLPVAEGKTTTTSLMTYGFNPKIAHWSPFHGGLYAVLDSVTRLAALGGDYKTARLTLQEYFEKLKKDPRRWGKPLAALLGAFTAEQALGIPAIGGKDSMSGSFQDLNVPPCLLSFAVDICGDHKVLSPEFKGPNHRLMLLMTKYDENLVPDFARQKEIYEKVLKMNEQGQILSAVSLKEGGIAEALIHCTLGNAVGVALNPMDRIDLLSPRYGSLLLEVTDDVDPGEYLLIPVGKTIEERLIRYKEEEIPLIDLVETYLTTLNEIYPPFLTSENDGALCPTWDKQLYLHSAEKVKPTVLIPVFPGTNCEYDSADAFSLAGAKSEVLVIRNQTPEELKDSVGELAAALKKSQILMLPGGFSAGDEPEGAAKFIAALFRDAYLQEAVAAHLEKKNLILGICNGFQALVKLGLLPHGEIRELTEEDATLTFNHIGRHVSTMARTKLISKLSPWFSQGELNQVYTVPVSHGEGRFAAPMGIIGELIANGQIATQYVNGKGKATMVAPDNPNGSLMAIEGITDKTGLILGKMGHSERCRPGLYKNIPGDFDQKIFVSGVKYFD
ncbi:MAG TPA: phosphoribosylformylglycinamidine synthase [Clostridiales bacterium]|nr:phosphoribosylformylglycinamidine synthase [Clostridiales bacterium]